MAFQLKTKEAAANGIRRIILEQIDHALESLQAPNVDEGVHEARKSMKRIRAVLRMVRGAIKNKTYKRENRFFRDVARSLSGARDSYVLIETIDTLIKNFSDQLSEDATAPIREHLLDAYRAKEQDLLGEQSSVLEAAMQQLEEGRERIKNLSFDETGFAIFEDGFERIYSDGRDEMEHAYEEASVEAFHEWRKSVKYLWHQLEVLTPTWETVLIPYAGALHDLSDYLGEDHDYAVLKAKLLELPPEISNGDTIYLLVQLINSHREQLERSAQDIGERLYAEKPKCFVRRHHHYWRAWRHEHATD